MTPRSLLLLGVLTGLAAGAAEPVGPRLGLAAEGFRSLDTAIRATGPEPTSPLLFDYTFDAAPCDWIPASGVWQVSNRYACDPTWSFFGGQSRGLACLWNKRRFTGDILFEVYAAFKYGLTYTETVWLERPSDICLTICGDGREPSSGYSFIFAGDEGSRTMIKRGSRTLAETTDPLFVTPSFSDRRPEREAMHWRWWRLEARRAGGRLEFWVDGRRALVADDTDPLPGGQVALWTVHNGLVVSRVRIAAEQVEAPPVVLVRQSMPAPLPGTETAAAANPVHVAGVAENRPEPVPAG